MDELLRRSMSAPVPRLSADFEPRLARALQRRAAPPHPFGQRLLSSYAAVSALVSVVVMQGQGLEGTVIASTMIGATLVLAIVARRVHGSARFSAR